MTNNQTKMTPDYGWTCKGNGGRRIVHRSKRVFLEAWLARRAAKNHTKQHGCTGLRVIERTAGDLPVVG